MTLTGINNLYIIHAPSIGNDYTQWLKKQHQIKKIKCIICADRPTLNEMLKTVELGAKAYCNSYMQQNNYQQMIQLVKNNQTWFPPQMITQAFALAAQSIDNHNPDNKLKQLTAKEKEISLLISRGYSNQQIATQLNISEATVKTHLTHTYKKLNIKDRVALILHIKSTT